MSEPTNSAPVVQVSKEGAPAPSPLRCIGGSIVAGAIAVVLYRLTSSIAIAFASKPLQTDNFTTQRISAAVRTLIIGLSSLGTGIFALAAFGLFALGTQLLLQRSKEESTPPNA
ncbi:DUF3082 domain-containing protein [Leptolyngbya sp. FACHB-321]|uniref:DUF3082 domain-containing protein n=1 Tax=Leptolyngbya sp. FACHB-321 TaxID=2692807 RepID=UPI00168475A9|nr:DUF3082 domain-containing protein [Leptolyngbya sp. FACHB-321]MBD2036677.1 DUF3082 domain-containing protein [Leptolyngbya sp. FACHB-321]